MPLSPVGYGSCRISPMRVFGFSPLARRFGFSGSPKGSTKFPHALLRRPRRPSPSAKSLYRSCRRFPLFFDKRRSQSVRPSKIARQRAAESGLIRRRRPRVIGRWARCACPIGRGQIPWHISMSHWHTLEPAHAGRARSAGGACVRRRIDGHRPGELRATITAAHARFRRFIVAAAYRHRCPAEYSCLVPPHLSVLRNWHPWQVRRRRRPAKRQRG